MKQKQRIRCPYCGAYATCRPASVVYGKSGKTKNSYLYICSRWPACDSYVGTHKKDRSPLGTPANKSLRHKRILAHRSLDAVQHRFQMTHIGMFSEYMCDRTIALCNQALEAAHIRAA